MRGQSQLEIFKILNFSFLWTFCQTLGEQIRAGFAFASGPLGPSCPWACHLR
jgi:hypothetical protein